MTNFKEGEKMRKELAAICIVLALCVCSGAWGGTWYVDRSVKTSGDGTSRETAFKKIQEGIDAATDGDTVIVAKGTYVENIEFKGKNIVLRSTDPTDPTVMESTMIDGNQAGSVVRFDGTEDESCVLSGFTIHNGIGTEVVLETGPARLGGGIFGWEPDGDYTRATIQNNIISGNSADAGGGLLGCVGTVLNNVITDNSASVDGGGVGWCNGMIRNNIVTGNSASDDGGGLASCDGIIENNRITGNAAADKGGGLDECQGTIQKNVVSGNSADIAGGLNECHGTIEGNLITGNSAEWGGGMSASVATMRNNAIIGNRAGQYGGALYYYFGTIENNTIVGNRAEGIGGAFYECNVYDSYVATIGNCIIWGNTAQSFPQLYNSSTPSYSCVEDWDGSGEGNIADDPLFVGWPLGAGQWSADATFDGETYQTTLADGAASWEPDALKGLFVNPNASQALQFVIASNTATTINVWGDASALSHAADAYEICDYRLDAASRCIDKGKNEDWMSDAVDLDGNPRIWRGKDSWTVDMGAYEYGSFPFEIVGVAHDGDGKPRLQWKSRPGETYTIWSCNDLSALKPWSRRTTKASEGDTTTWTDLDTTSPRKFYRIGRE